MSVKTSPLVSIGMSVFNCGHMLEAALSSILDQTYPHWELLLFDDGSRDDTLRVARGFDDARIQVISDGRNEGLPRRLNQAIAMSRGKYFARMDGDDIAYPERLQLQLEYMEAHPEVDLVGSAVLVFRDNGSVAGSLPFRASHEELCRNPWSGFYICHPTWFGRTEWFRTYQYRPEVLKGQDQDLLLRAYRSSRLACLPTILLGYRQDSLSRKKRLVTRYHFTRSVLRQLRLEGAYLSAVRGLLGQTAKAALETVTIGTPLEGKLRQPSMPIDPAVLERWNEVWTRCQVSRTERGDAGQRVSGAKDRREIVCEIG